MAWVAADRAVRTLEKDPSLRGDAGRWRAMRDEVHREVCEKGYDPERNTFTQSYGSRELDAATLLIPGSVSCRRTTRAWSARWTRCGRS